MKILFITRKYPPSKGGMENFSYKLYENLQKKTDVKKISYGGSQKYLPFILPWFILLTIVNCVKYRPDVVLLGDALLSYLIFPLRFLNINVATICHGLDIAFNSRLYQSYMKLFLPQADHYVAVSNNTKKILIKKGIKSKLISVIHNAVDVDEYYQGKYSKELFKKYKIRKNKINLITVGRLVTRKGVYWFADNVFSKINKDYNYIVVGDGPDKNKIKDLGIKNMYVLGKISDQNLKSFYKTADMFIMPNIKIKGDVEGYGIVALEASSAGLMTLAAGVDGINEAITDNKNGIIVKEKNINEFIRMIEKYSNKNKRKKFTKMAVQFNRKYRSWDTAIKKYMMVLK